MDNAAIEDMFSALGPVKVKRMFGGKGIYFDGRILALEVRRPRRNSRRPAPPNGPMTERGNP